MTAQDRYRSALVGLAVGDAVGTAVEFEATRFVRAGRRQRVRRPFAGGGVVGARDDRHLPRRLPPRREPYDDADTTAAVYGEIAGGTCGVDAIPADRWERLALRDTIERLAHGLLALAEAM